MDESRKFRIPGSVVVSMVGVMLVVGWATMRVLDGELAAQPWADGRQDRKEPFYTDDPNDPFPMPTELLGVKLMEQTDADKLAKSTGCINCHQHSHDPHNKATVRLGCTDCHGGNASTNDIRTAHVQPKHAQFWRSSANPVRSYALLNHESPEFVRFVNPGDFRIAHISCGTSGCHPNEVQTNRKQIMSTGCMLWGAALYNNGAVPNKRARFGEAYSMTGAPLRLMSNPPPDEFELKRGVVPYLDPLPRFEMSQPSNVLRIFERGGRFRPEVGIPERGDEPGRSRVRLSDRGLGTQNRTDPVFVSLNKTRLFDPTLNFLGTNDHPGDYRSSGCTSCHMVYANDRSPVASGPYAKFGNQGRSFSKDPTIPKTESGHPIEHVFTNGVPTSQCMVCHIHPGTTVMNSYLGYQWWDEESEGKTMYPGRRPKLGAEEVVAAHMRNPNESHAYTNAADPKFLDDLSLKNPELTQVRFADFHSHGWSFKAVLKRDRCGKMIDFFGDEVKPVTPQKLDAAIEFPCMVKSFHMNDKSTDSASCAAAERSLDAGRKGKPVHLMDIHMEKGMHCVDCHFVQDMHGNNRLQMEVRAGTEIACIDCHGTNKEYTTLRTSGPASYTSAPNNAGRNLKAMRTPSGKPRFEVLNIDDPKNPNKIRVRQNSMVEPGLSWEIVQTKDTIDRNHPRYNAKSALAKTVRVEDGQTVWGELPENGKCAHENKNMSCIACHSAWNPSCYGCHLPQKANLKMPQLHAEGEVSRNYTSYNFQTLREDVYMLARDGDATGNKINPARSSCAIHVGSYNNNRESIYPQQQTLSAEGFGGTAFSTNVPHTVRGKGVRETKQCTDCHLAKANDNNAWMAQLLMQGTQTLNHIGRYCWVATGEEGLAGVVVTEREEPQAVFGSSLHQLAFPEDYQKHCEKKGKLEQAYEHPGRDISVGLGKPFQKSEVLNLSIRGEYLLAACGAGGIRAFDVAFIDNKGFSERITTAPVSPWGQKFHVPSAYATCVVAPSTVAVDPTRTRLPENKEGPIHPYFGYIYATDREEGLILVGIGTMVDGNPDNNFLKRDLTFNPEGMLKGAETITLCGTYAYIGCDLGLVVVSLDDPKQPKVTAVLPKDVISHAKSIQVQFRYAYVADAEGIKILDITDPARPMPKAKLRMDHVHSIYLGRTYAYVAAGPRGLVILDITNPEAPKVDQTYSANGVINDLHDVKLGITYNSQFAYLADGKNGMRIVQLTSPETPGNDGFSVRPTPKLVATYVIPKGGHALAISKGLDRDRAVDESGNQIGVFGRVGARPMNLEEQRKMFLRNGKPWYVSNDPMDKDLYIERRKKPGESAKP